MKNEDYVSENSKRTNHTNEGYRIQRPLWKNRKRLGDFMGLLHITIFLSIISNNLVSQDKPLELKKVIPHKKTLFEVQLRF